MNRSIATLLLLVSALTLHACGNEPEFALVEAENTSAKPGFVVLDESLQQLKQDFNANKGRVRLLFIVGDTCGICLRGMADLNDAFVAEAQNDDRLLTLVVHVPTMGAKEKHVAPSIPLLDGPRVQHYWDGVGRSGIHVGTALDLDGIYAWDVWLAYGPDAQWLEEAPPKPEFWMHQLGPLDKELKLDAELFAEKTLALMDSIESGPVDRVDEDAATLIADGTEIGWVGQPLSVPVRQHIRAVGGYQDLSKIRSITQTGTLTAGGRSTEVVQKQDSETGLSRSYAQAGLSLPSAIENVLASTWELNGPLFEWKDKGHQLRLAGMLKIGPSLAWKVLIRMNSGMRRSVFIDSHGGDIILSHYFSASGELLFSVRSGDFSEVDGIRLAHSHEYLDPHGIKLAEEHYQHIGIEFQ